jgi:hypothetical protein
MTEITRMPTRRSYLTEWVLGITGVLAAGFGAWMYYVPTDWFLGGLVEGWPFAMFIAAGLLLTGAFGLLARVNYVDDPVWWRVWSFPRSWRWQPWEAPLPSPLSGSFDGSNEPGLSSEGPGSASARVRRPNRADQGLSRERRDICDQQDKWSGELIDRETVPTSETPSNCEAIDDI